MKNRILLLAEDSDTTEKWKQIIDISLDSYSVEAFETPEQWVTSELTKFNIVLITSKFEKPNDKRTRTYEDLKKIFTVFKASKIPIIVNRAFAKNYTSVDQLVNDGILAIVEDDMSIIQISQVLNIVLLGGIHIDPEQLLRI